MFLLEFAAKDAPRESATSAFPASRARSARRWKPSGNTKLPARFEKQRYRREHPQNQRLPQFDVTASYNQNGVGGTPFKQRATIGSARTTVFQPGRVIDSSSIDFLKYNYSGYSVRIHFQHAGVFRVLEAVAIVKSPAADADHDRAVTEGNCPKRE